MVDVITELIHISDKNNDIRVVFGDKIHRMMLDEPDFLEMVDVSKLVLKAYELYLGLKEKPLYKNKRR